MGDYRRDELSTMMDLDLNQEPLDLSDDSLLGLGFTNDHEVQLTRDGVQDRIRQLESVYARARWRQNRDPPRENIVNLVDDMSNEGRKRVKRDSSHLVAQALELDMGVAKVVGDGEGFFDCNICLDTVREPVLTCCGHLFCWACFYRLPYVYSTAKECPVCKGEVTDSNITPIYGNGKGDHAPGPDSSGSGAKVPPRPRANRVESVRQNRLTRRVSQIPVADALRRIRIGLSREPPPPPPDTVLAAGGGARRHRTRLVGRALSEVDDMTAGGPTFGFVFDSPVLDVTRETSVNEAQTPSGSRRRNREPRGRRRGPRS